MGIRWILVYSASVICMKTEILCTFVNLKSIEKKPIDLLINVSKMTLTEGNFYINIHFQVYFQNWSSNYSLYAVNQTYVILMNDKGKQWWNHIHLLYYTMYNKLFVLIIRIQSLYKQFINRNGILFTMKSDLKSPSYCLPHLIKEDWSLSQIIIAKYEVELLGWGQPLLMQLIHIYHKSNIVYVKT